MKPKQTCFISYSRKDNDLNTIKMLIKYLEEASENRIDFLFDENLEIGKNFISFMDLINNVDAVIVLMTPEYKRKAEDRSETGVAYEFPLILERLEDSIKLDKSRGDSFCFIPLIFSREFNNCCPKQIKYHKSLDFSDFIVLKHGLSSATEPKYKKYFKEITSQILAIESLNKTTVQKEFYRLLEVLFYQTKHDNITITDVGNNIDLYVKTNSFRALRNQATYFFLGRKGSGKTTLGYLLYLFDGVYYKAHTNIIVDSLNLEYSVGLILSRSSLYKDLNAVIHFSFFFRITWEILIYIKCFQVIVEEYKNNKLKENQSRYVPIIKEFLSIFQNVEDDKVFEYAHGNDHQDLNSLFQWCLSEVSLHIEKSILKARTEESNFHYDITALLTRNQFLTAILPPNVLRSFYSIVQRCERKFFISFDGFDNLFEKFRNNTYAYKDNNRIIRMNIEKLFLAGFLELIEDVKGNQRGDIFYNHISVCVTVPKDRFLEIKHDKRDSYTYINRFHEIKWSGIELAIMLRKRLELLYQYRSNKINTKTNQPYSPVERLNNVIEQTVDNLPRETSIRIGTKSFLKDTFINILRHSFWRPREIIIYYAKLIAVLDDIKSRNIQSDNFTISKIVSETTFDIIETEFISEFKNYCENLVDIINLFGDNKQILDHQEVEEIIGSYDFKFASFNDPERDIKRKIEFLYDIGFLGVEISDVIRDRYKLLIKDIFCFNVSSRTFELLDLQRFDDCKFVIHPIFCEYLRLDTTRQDRLVLDIDWDYLRSQDIYVRP